MTERWSNWAGDQVCHPQVVERPRDLGQLASCLERARHNDWTVRVAGAGHSFTEGVLTDGMLLSLEHMNRVLEVDRATGMVKVEAGITLHDLSVALDADGLALENLGDISVQSLAGATATGTHGTGKRLRNLSANVTSVGLMLADGSTVEVDAGSDEDAWRAARVSLGALGIVTTMTVKTFPAFTLRGVEETRPIDEVLERLDELVAENQHFEFYTFPHSNTVWTRTNNRVEVPPQPRSRATEWFQDIFMVNTVYGMVLKTGRRFPRAIPRLNRMTSALAGGTERIDRSFRIFASPRLFRFTESEYAIPREHVTGAVRAIRKAIDDGGYDVPLPIEVRFVAPDDALLSPAHGRETAYIAVHMFERMDWEPYFRSVRAIMHELEARPHWGKRHFETAETLAPRYPEWDRFQAVRRRMDPEGLFQNRYIETVLGGI